AVLDEVVADAERERVEQLLTEFRLGIRGVGRRRQEEAARRRDRGDEAAPVGPLTVDGDGSGPLAGGAVTERVLAPAGVLGAQAEGPVEIDDLGLPALHEARRLEEVAAVLADEAAAVEDEAVLTADHVGVGDDALVVGGAGGDHLAAGGLDADAVRRGG